jgi:hypothetical protein
MFEKYRYKLKIIIHFFFHEESFLMPDFMEFAAVEKERSIYMLGRCCYAGKARL